METKTVENAVATPEAETGREIKIEKTFGPITVERVEPHKFKKDLMTIMLKQQVTTTTYYPGAAINNSLNSSLFGEKTSNTTPESYPSVENRYALVNTENVDVTVEQAQEALKNMPNAVLYKILSNHPILSAEDKAAIESSDINFTKVDLALKQITRYPKGHDLEGEVIVKDGKVMYRRICFSDVAQEDIDKRNNDISDQYMPEEIESLLKGKIDIESQKII